jgi:hypothetical protein
MELLPAMCQGWKRTNIAQFVAPAMVQFISTPLHLVGLDLYNRPGVGWGERLGLLKRAYLTSSFARIMRIVPAFGVGGVVNTDVRSKFMARYE